MGAVVVRAAHRFSAVRVPGLAAEMAYYLVLSLVPLVTALGASLGLVGGLLGEGSVQRMEQALTGAVEAVLGPDLADDAAVPLLEELLQQQQVGTALGGLAGALFLGSRAFRSAMRALGDAYQVEDRRGLVRLWGLALALTVAAVGVVTAVLGVVVVGPLLGGGRWLADRLGWSSAFEATWSLGRWPFVLLVCAALLVWLYQAGQQAETSWRDSVPGAVVATGALVVLLAGFRVYVDAGGSASPDVEGGPAAVQAAGRFIGTALALMLLAWAASLVVLLGGVLNAEWRAARPRPEG